MQSLRKPLSAYVIAPAWLIKSRREHLLAERNLRRLGFNILNPAFRPAHMLCAGSAAKAAEIRRAFLDPRADVVMALRGGYGSMKILPYLDFSVIKKSPKILAGFSDLSALLNPIYEKTGVIGLHSPMLWNFTSLRPLATRSFINALDGFPNKNLLDGAVSRTFAAGRSTGVLKGGNLVTLTALIGTPWETDTRGAVVFLEDVDEKMHEIDRCLAHWALAGKFQGIRGLALGDFRGVDTRAVFDVIRSLVNVKCPVIYCPDVGHVPRKITFPVGARVALNAPRISGTAALEVLSLDGYPAVGGQSAKNQ
ncbi:MAG: LD-carboxypeptidase [Elusimicrobia bacterium HGW-Elusimicrobia-1]|nr:MAG: LD-carboxypeptidase [Elusimicrobia bacterium HGW-Elusimicrobia-1]